MTISINAPAKPLTTVSFYGIKPNACCFRKQWGLSLQYRPSTSLTDHDSNLFFFFFCSDLTASLTQCYGCVVLWLCSLDLPSCPTAYVVFALHLHCVPAAPGSAPAPCPHCLPGLVLSVVLPGVAVKRRRLPAVVQPLQGSALTDSTKHVAVLTSVTAVYLCCSSPSTSEICNCRN